MEFLSAARTLHVNDVDLTLWSNFAPCHRFQIESRSFNHVMSELFKRGKATDELCQSQDNVESSLRPSLINLF